MYSSFQGWRSLTLALVLVSSSAWADQVRITSINGQYNLDHKNTLSVRPGDVISLGADVLSENDNGNYYGNSSYYPQYRHSDEFVWSSSNQSNVQCDPSNDNVDWFNISGFEPTQYGVNYYVPEDMKELIVITVRHKGENDEDTITLKNEFYSSGGNYYGNGYQPVSHASEYNYDSLDPYYALQGMGRWMQMRDGRRYWVPYTDDSNWAPYQRGQWVWADGELTWRSYDRWGWLTDHYGVWRYHRELRWVWVPFSNKKYRPHTVTWIYSDNHIGWYPYYDQFEDGYRLGYADGFIDGYYEGLADANYQNYGGYSSSYYKGWYYPGFTFVQYTHFYLPDFWDFRIYQSHNTYTWFNDCHRLKRVGRFTYDYDWITRRTGGRLPTANVVVRKLGNGRDSYRYVDYNERDLPNRYKGRISYGRDYEQKRAPVGSVIRRENGRTQVIRDSDNSGRKNNRGVGITPTYRDNQGNSRPVTRETRKEVEPNGDRGTRTERERETQKTFPQQPQHERPQQNQGREPGETRERRERETKDTRETPRTFPQTQTRPQTQPRDRGSSTDRGGRTQRAPDTNSAPSSPQRTTGPTVSPNRTERPATSPSRGGSGGRSSSESSSGSNGSSRSGGHSRSRGQ